MHEFQTSINQRHHVSESAFENSRKLNFFAHQKSLKKKDTRQRLPRLWLKARIIRSKTCQSWMKPMRLIGAAMTSRSNSKNLMSPKTIICQIQPESNQISKIKLKCSQSSETPDCCSRCRAVVRGRL